MKTLKVKATYIGSQDWGYKIGEDYTIDLFVYEKCIAIITPNDKRYELPNIIALLRHFNNIRTIGTPSG